MASVKTNFAAVSKQMERIGKALYNATVIHELDRAFKDIGKDMVKVIGNSMRNTPRASYFYRKGVRGNIKHFPSQPKNPPAVDQAQLWENIRFDTQRLSDNFQFIIGTDQKHGFFLENGTIHMTERPWLFPVVHKFEPQIYDMIKRITGAELRSAFKAGGQLTGEYTSKGWDIRFK